MRTTNSLLRLTETLIGVNSPTYRSYNRPLETYSMIDT